MGLGAGLKSVIGFLTIIPMKVQGDSLEQASKYMALFPLVGVLVGGIAGGAAWGLKEIFPIQIVGFLTLGVILLVTGLHHTDGLLDVGDALMFQGSVQDKLRVMRDHNTGTGGFSLGFIVLMVTALCIGSLKKDILIQSLIVSEIVAKFSMVITAYVGISASEGTGRYFVNALHIKYRMINIWAALLFSTSICIFLLKFIGVLCLTSTIVSSIILVRISLKQFKGVTGDVFGTTNEISRMVSLLTIVGALGWG